MAKYSELEIDGVVGDIWDKEAIHNEALPDIIRDSIYPVGSIYFTSSDTFDPNDVWGGTWERIEAGRVIVSSGTGYELGATGGASTHRLTAAECALPSHQHVYAKAANVTGSHVLTASEIPAHTHGSKSLVGHANFRKWTTGNMLTYADGILARSDTSSSATSVESYGSDPNKVDRLTVTATHEHASVGGGGGHTHPISIAGANTEAANGVATQDISLMQPYVAYNIWKRTA